MKSERMEFLARLPLLLNSALSEKQVTELALEFIIRELDAERATVFLLRPETDELEFWAIDHLKSQSLRSQRMPASAGIVGTVIRTRKPEIVENAQSDPRFYKAIDQETGFTTRSILCVPLTAHGRDKLGAIQVLNKKSGTFSSEDLEFARLFADHVAIAVYNTQLLLRLQESLSRCEINFGQNDKALRQSLTKLEHPITILRGLATTEAVSTDKVFEALSDLVEIQADLTLACNLPLTEVALHRRKTNLSSILRSLGRYVQRLQPTSQLEATFELPKSDITVLASEAHLNAALRTIARNLALQSSKKGSLIIGATRHEQAVRVYLVKSAGADTTKETDHCTEVESELQVQLATASAIISLHGSELDVINRESMGATISFFLPCSSDSDQTPGE